MTRPTRPPISRARMAAAIAVHFVVPAYVLVLVGDAALGHAPGTLAGWLPHALGLGGQFVLAYAGLSVVGTGVAWAMDRAQPPAPAAARAPLAALIMQEMGRWGAPMDGLLTRLGALALSDSDPVGADVAMVLDTASQARGDAAPSGDLTQRTMGALTTLIEAAERNAQESAIPHQDRAHTVALYVQSKYGQQID